MKKVICPGELLIDFICEDKDKSLAQGEHFIKKAGGAPANVAVAIKKMGVQSYMLGTVGDDQFGIFLEDTLKKYGVNTDYLIKLPDYDTTLAFVSLDSNGERDFRFNRGADEAYQFSMIDEKLLNEANVYHFGSATAFLEGALRDTYYQLLLYGVKNNKIISFDPNYRDALFAGNEDSFISNSLEFIKHTDILKVSDEEAELLTGEKDIEVAARKLNELGAKYVLITLGKKGTLISTSTTHEYVLVTPVNMVDATGAGDAFIGSIIARVSGSEDLSMEAMRKNVEFANKVGAMTVQKYGALDSIPYKDEVMI